MATTQSINAIEILFDTGRGLIQRKREQFHAAQRRRKIYRTTVNELSSLSARGLSDLGIHRGSIKQIALEAANGI